MEFLQFLGAMLTLMGLFFGIDYMLAYLESGVEDAA